MRQLSKLCRPLSIGSVAVCSLPIGTLAQSVSGDIDSTMTLEAACEVNGSTATSNVAFGTLDFGTQSTFFITASAQVNGNGSGSISIQCTDGYDAVLTVGTGLHDASGAGAGRALANGTLYIPYDLYSDAGFNTVLADGSEIDVTGDGTVQLVPIYGRAIGAADLVPGTYTDTIAVTLTF